MKLRTKVITLLVGVFALYGVADYAIQQTVVYPSFLSLEHDEAVKDIERCREAITRENDHLDTLCHDWSAWDASWKYVEDHNQQFVDENFVLTTFTESKLNLIYYVDMKGEVVWGEIRDLETPEDTLTLAEFPSDRFPKDHRFLRHKSIESHIAGLVMTAGGPMLLSSRPILTSDNTGPIRGTIMMGRFLTQNTVDILHEQTKVDFKIWSVEGNAAPPEDRLALGSISPTTGVLVRERGEDTLAVYSTYPNIDGKPALLMRADVARDISARGADAMRATVISVAVAGVITLLILVLLIQTTVVGPILELTSHATKIGSSSDLTESLAMERSDEIGTLAREFDGMVEKLAESRSQFMKLSRDAGMADVASGVLHNVGNVMNSVNVSTSVISQNLRKSKVSGLSKAVGLLEEHKEDLGSFITDDDRGKQLPGYLKQLAEHLNCEHEDMLGELASLSKNLEHVNSIIQAQQTYTHASAVTEPTSLAKAADTAVTMVEAAFRRHGITIHRENVDMPSVPIDRAKVMQILVNLLTNAKEALKSVAKGDRQIMLRTDMVGEDRACFEIVDNGIGITPENLAKIFANGFTTKKEGSGIGLHTAALAAKEMGGSLTAHSNGTGQGATFTFELPIRARTPGKTE